MRGCLFSRVSLATIAAALSVTAWIVAGPSMVQAAVIAKGNTSECAFKLAGPIAEGDTDKLDPSAFPDGSSLCLDSSGGDFAEGMKMAEWLEANTVGTTIEGNASCLGACAIAFMGGSQFVDTEYPEGFSQRTLHLGGKLGFNAPYLSATDKTGRDAGETYSSALQLVARMMALGSDGEGGYFPEHLMLKLLAAGPGKYYMIDDIIKAQKFNIDLLGAPKAKWTVRALCNACIVRNERRASVDACDKPVATTMVGKDIVQTTFYGFSGEGSYYCSTRLSKKTGEAWIASEQGEDEISSAKDEDFKLLTDEDALPVGFKDN